MSFPGRTRWTAGWVRFPGDPRPNAPDPRVQATARAPLRPTRLVPNPTSKSLSRSRPPLPVPRVKERGRKPRGDRDGHRRQIGPQTKTAEQGHPEPHSPRTVPASPAPHPPGAAPTPPSRGTGRSLGARLLTLAFAVSTGRCAPRCSFHGDLALPAPARTLRPSAAGSPRAGV